MGSASDRSPDPTRTTNWARPPLPTGPRGIVSPPSSRASPFGRLPKLLDRFRDALHTRHYSPRIEQGNRRTMLPEAVKGPLWEHLVRVQQIHQQDLAEGYGSDSAAENARRRKMQRVPHYRGEEELSHGEDHHSYLSALYPSSEGDEAQPEPSGFR